MKVFASELLEISNLSLSGNSRKGFQQLVRPADSLSRDAFLASLRDLNTGAYADNESLIAHPAHDALGVLSFSLNVAPHSLVSDGWERSWLWAALRDICWKLFSDVGHDVD